MEFLNAIFTNTLIMRGAIVGISISLCAALLGICLVLKRYSMIGDGLSHVAFGSLSVAFVLGVSPLYVTIPVVMLTAFLLLRASESGKIKGDSAIALIAGTSLALGVAVSGFFGINIDVNSYMFGSILLIGKDELIFCIPIAIVIILSFILCYHDIFLITFDEDFARASGTKVGVYKTILSLLTALVVVIGMRLMGTLLISSLIIFPGLTSMRVFKSFKGVILCSLLVSIFSFISGLAFSYYLGIATGASIVLTNAIVFGIFFLTGKILKRS